MRHAAHAALLAAAVALTAAPLAAQSYRVRIDTRAQTVAFRGVQIDSIAAADAAPGPDGGLVSPDGFAVNCGGIGFCYFFRPGAINRAAPVTSRVAGTAWGFGVPGLRVHADLRLSADLQGDDHWPGTDPGLQLVEGFAEYATEAVTARLGRQALPSRLGWLGFDGVRGTGRLARHGLEAEAYLGWGLARGVALPVTSPALDPLDQFQPRDRQIVAGLAAGWRTAAGELRAEYRREIDPGTDYFVSERAALSGTLRIDRRWAVAAGADYDIAFGWLGSADASVRYTGEQVGGVAGYRRHRPHFDLWTIWGAFSPVPYDEARGMIWLRPVPSLRVTLRGERFWYAPADAGTPLVPTEDAGWRAGWGAVWQAGPAWTVDAAYLAEFGPGAAARSADAGITWAPHDRLSVAAHAALLERPLEFRFSQTDVASVGVDASWSPSAALRLGGGVTHFREERQRPDPSGIDWNQTRLYARVTLLFESGADVRRLPPGRPRPRLVR